MKNYWDRKKQGMFPLIKDWSKPQNHIRKKNIHKQTHKEWFWFNTSSYKLIHYGNSSISIIMFLFLATYFMMKSLTITTLFCVLGLYFTFDLSKKLKNYKNIKDMTFYDLYLREY